MDIDQGTCSRGKRWIETINVEGQVDGWVAMVLQPLPDGGQHTAEPSSIQSAQRLDPRPPKSSTALNMPGLVAHAWTRKVVQDGESVRTCG